MLPRRGEAVRELDLPLPAVGEAVHLRHRPAGMPAHVGGRPLKRWRYVGAYGPDLMLCAGEAWIGPFPQRWWAIALPDGSLLQGGRGLRIGPDHVQVAAGDVAIDLTVGAGRGFAPIESVHANGRRGWVWTRKQTGVPIGGSVSVGDRLLEVDCLGAIDDSAGYHRRDTEWRWSAGVGTAADGRAVGWNLVAGVNDDAIDSERTVWIGDEASEVGPVAFADDLSSVAFDDGRRFEFSEWSAREHRLNALLVRTAYRQPFGTFAGELAGGLRLAAGYGVMEWHRVRW